jgi:hypothetical protein
MARCIEGGQNMLSRSGLSDEHAELAQASSSVMSRHLLDLGDRNRKKEPGFGLVMGRPNLMELRKHEHVLTPKGKALFERLYLLLTTVRRRASLNPSDFFVTLGPEQKSAQ